MNPEGIYGYQCISAAVSGYINDKKQLQAELLFPVHISASSQIRKDCQTSHFHKAAGTLVNNRYDQDKV